MPIKITRCGWYRSIALAAQAAAATSPKPHNSIRQLDAVSEDDAACADDAISGDGTESLFGSFHDFSMNERSNDVGISRMFGMMV